MQIRLQRYRPGYGTTDGYGNARSETENGGRCQRIGKSFICAGIESCFLPGGAGGVPHGIP